MVVARTIVDRTRGVRQNRDMSGLSRSHFDVIGAEMEAEKAEQRLEALRTSPRERIEIGFMLGAVPRDEATERALDERAEAQIELARKRPRPVR